MGFPNSSRTDDKIAGYLSPVDGACEFEPDWKPILLDSGKRSEPGHFADSLAEGVCRFRLRPRDVALFQVLCSAHEGARCLSEVVIWPPLLASATSASSDGVPARCSSLPARRKVRDVSRVPDHALPSALPPECDAR